MELFPDAGYMPDEIAIPDSFIHPYIGKQYIHYINGRPVITETEILSTGLRLLAEKPDFFKQRDPDHYQFVLNVLGLKEPHGAKNEF